jgi:divalent metal cation (Fe/Co/Zn/Cd) transporter
VASKTNPSLIPDATVEQRHAAIRVIQLISVVWLSIEFLVSVVAGARAHSVALLAFGGDSGIELASAVIVLFRFTGAWLSERLAARITAILLFLLAAFIVATSSLSLLGLGPQPTGSYLGIFLLLAAAVVMPWLARQKKQLARATASSALAADAVQSSLCAWMSWIALGGLILNSLFKIPWADPAAALVLTPIIIKEGREAWRENACHTC